MPKQKRLAVAAVVALTLALTGCGRSIEQRIQDRDLCESAGGVYEEWTGGDSVQRGICDLSTNVEVGGQ